MCVHLRSFWVWLWVTEAFAHRCACVFWDFLNAPPPAAPFLHQFMMQFLFRVMKYTWLLPPERTDAKNTCGTTRVSGLQGRWHSWVQLLSVISLTLSFLSQRNFSLWALLCMKTPSRWPVSTDLISMAFSPHPMIWLEQMWAVGQMWC